MDLLDICFITTQFQFEVIFYQHKRRGMAMGKSLSPVVSNIFMKQYEMMALDTADHKPNKCLRYISDTFMV
jgi:hypothetical protein